MITSCLSLCSYNVSLVFLERDCPYSESYDFTLFILVYREYLSSKHYQWSYLGLSTGIGLNFPQRTCVGFFVSKLRFLLGESF